MSGPIMPLTIARAHSYSEKTAIVDAAGAYSYGELLEASGHIASALLAGRDDLGEERVGFLVAPGFPWVAVLWGIWRAGGIAVPLPLGSPPTELEYFAGDTRAAALITDDANWECLARVGDACNVRVLGYNELLSHQLVTLPDIASNRRAMILYTSGTTSRPKGVVTTHENIESQITSLVEAWEWSGDDRIVLCLPLHHVHGIINVVSCALWSGAVCEMLPRFDAVTVWERISGGRLTLFMAVPTIYVKLIAAWDASPPEKQAILSDAAARLRLMVSGSAALPLSTLERWREITSHTLLERYGMTEIGMALSNPYRGERVPGSVGRPLPGVDVRLVSDDGEDAAAGMPGGIEVRGDNVFVEYWGKPEATREAFRDGWFRTGDTAIIENGVYRILGRTNVDILKTGGHKVSALEIEETLREHPAVVECAVVGVPDDEWGERVAVALVCKGENMPDLEQLRAWAKERMAVHKIPSRLLVLDALPRNAMGKVTKPAVRALFQEAE
ncbi:MAG: acyl-CoA synthetase [Candidatus Korobacteraceae bacterium]